MNNSNVKIIFEDNHLLVVEKPPNIPSQEDNTKDIDMLTLLKQELKTKYNKPGNVFLGLVHRLDRPVGGVMVFAKTSKSASRLSEQIRLREFNKTYLAVIHGIPEKLNDTLKHCLLKDNATNTVKVVKSDVKGAKEAVLDYTVLESKEGLSLVKIILHTGRPHQIRVQFAQIGHSLYGDQKYGKDEEFRQIALWSNSLTFAHPISKKKITFTSQPPNDYPWTLFNIKK
jgi:23S rRNA pseudouridine1911/1915/1917 synthase